MAVFLTAMAALTMLAVVNASGSGFSNSAERLDCNTVVKRIISKTQGCLLSVRIHGGQCVISILVQRDNARPRKIIIRADPRQTNLTESRLNL